MREAIDKRLEQKIEDNFEIITEKIVKDRNSRRYSNHSGAVEQFVQSGSTRLKVRGRQTSRTREAVVSIYLVRRRCRKCTLM